MITICDEYMERLEELAKEPLGFVPVSDAVRDAYLAEHPIEPFESVMQRLRDLGYPDVAERIENEPNAH